MANARQALQAGLIDMAAMTRVLIAGWAQALVNNPSGRFQLLRLGEPSPAATSTAPSTTRCGCARISSP